MNERPQAPDDHERKKPHRGALSWILEHWKISILLGVEEDEPRSNSSSSGLRQVWPLVVTLLAIVAAHATMEDDIRVLPLFLFLLLVLVILVPIFYARQRGLRTLARFLG